MAVTETDRSPARADAGHANVWPSSPIGADPAVYAGRIRARRTKKGSLIITVYGQSVLRGSSLNLQGSNYSR